MWLHNFTIVRSVAFFITRETTRSSITRKRYSWRKDTFDHSIARLMIKSTAGRTCESDALWLGRAYEYLIERFADDAGKKGGEFYTPHLVVRLIVELLDPKPGMRISDPTCGSGGMLIEMRAARRRHRRASVWATCQRDTARAGKEPRHLGHRQDEPAPARPARRPD